MLKGILRKKLDSEILTPQDLALKFLLQPHPMKLTVSQCRKGSGFLNGLWRQVRNHEILLVSGNCCFSSGEVVKQNEVGEAMRSSSKQNKNIKLWDIPEVTSFLTNLSLRGQLHWAWPKLDFIAKSIRIHFFGFENIFRCYRETKT